MFFLILSALCQHGRLHLWPEAGIVEVFDGLELAPPGTTGELVCTGLLNTDMSLLRYRVGGSFYSTPGRKNFSEILCRCRGAGMPANWQRSSPE